MLDWSFQKTSRPLQLYAIHLFVYSITFLGIATLSLRIMEIFYNFAVVISVLGGCIFFIAAAILLLNLLLKMEKSRRIRSNPDMQLKFKGNQCAVERDGECIGENLADPNRLIRKYKPIELENIGDSTAFFEYLESLPAALRKRHAMKYLVPSIGFELLILTILWQIPSLQLNTESTVWQVLLLSWIYLQIIAVSVGIYKTLIQESINRINQDLPTFRKLYFVPLSALVGILWIAFLVLIYQQLFSLLSFLFSKPMVYTPWTGFLSSEVTKWLYGHMPMTMNAVMIFLSFVCVSFLLYIFEAKHAFGRFMLFFYSKNPDSKAHPYVKQEDKPYWLAGESYWVMRFTYFWGYELTYPRPHTDWERIECWCNAETGMLEWVVFDYHYRELWCEVDANLEALYVFFDGNFHTPLPVASTIYQSRLKEKMGIIRPSFLLREKKDLDAQFINWLEEIRKKHSEKMISEFFQHNLVAKTCARLPWTHWRYCKGADRDEIYGTGEEGASMHQPSEE